MNEVTPTFARDRAGECDEPELIDLAPGETSLSFLRKIYRSPAQPMSRRLRAAMAALPHEHPKLGIIATTNMNGDTFAAMLDRAIERSGTATKQIEHQPGEPEQC